MRRSLIALLKAPLPPRLRIFVKELIGFPIPFDSDYEPTTQQALRHLLHQGDIGFDIGANAGELSVVMSRLVAPSGRIYAFEANPRCAALLKKTLRLNRIKNCSVIFGAVSDQNEHRIPLYADDRLGMHGVASSLISSWEAGDQPKRQFLVPSVKLDDYCSEFGLAPGVVKIDVEGVERTVLAGFQRHLETTSPHVILEARSEGTDGPLHYLEKLGYLIASPEPWHWITSGEFVSPERFERSVLAVHRDRAHLVDGLIV